MRKIAVLTSGGDAPGMNAAIRAIVRTSLNKDISIIGFKNGYEGIIDNEHVSFDKRSVGNIIQRGGSILHTSRSSRFLKKKYRQVAEDNLRALGIDGLIVIGGEGSTKGAIELSKISKTRCVVVPATIDRDMPLVGSTIGFDTAINTALSAIDKIRDTATTANVTHIVEVMGRDCGWLGIHAGIGAGAEVTIIPEVKIDITKLSKNIKNQLYRGKKGCIIILAEGGFPDGGQALADLLKEHDILDLRVTTLGHIQRGGNPSSVDRILATELGVDAVISLMNGASNVVIAKPINTIKRIDFEEIIKTDVKVDMYLHDLIENIA
tara:strand:- start:609 stop:1574 length:966 start_codon:yes stop_codon:yes gene_type:complete